MGGRFFVSSVIATWEIEPSGGTRQLLDHGVYGIIEHDDRLFACSWNGLLMSSDEGATWDTLPYDGAKGQFFVVDGHLCLLRASSILQVNADTGSTTPLAVDGLPFDGHSWGAAIRFGENVYLATHQGLFYRPVRDFLIPRSTD
jgi:hypothetical protein